MNNKNIKFGLFTDIHFGARQNSTLHNQDNLDYIDWFILQVKKHGCNRIGFLGDWFENRNAINIETLDYSYKALKKLDALGMPIYFIVGNHDLYRRNTRDVHSVSIFNEFKNIVVVDKPMVVEDDFLFCPFIFEHEYPSLAQYADKRVWFGHFEFKGFILTGAAMKSEHGLNHELFKKQKFIFSGHYHKRQAQSNVIYIGNPFPTNYGDAGDVSRGMAIYDHSTESVDFNDWAECPTFLRTKLSDVLSGTWKLEPNDRMRVSCVNDVELSYSEAQMVKEAMKEQYNFREFNLEENYADRKDALENSETDEEISESQSIDEVVINLLGDINEIKSLDSAKLVAIYKELK